MSTIAFQGFLGAYSDLACRHAFPGSNTLPCPSFEAAMQGGTSMTRTQGGHIAGRTRGSSASAASPVTAPDGEARLDGNQVVLEEQMMKMSDARADYDAAISMYQQSMSMLRTAARRPGG